MTEGEDFVQKLFGAPQPDEQPEPEPVAEGEAAAPAEQSPEDAHRDLLVEILGPSKSSAALIAQLHPAVDRTAIAKRNGLPEQVADRLRGTTAEEVEADARELAEAIGAAPEPEHVALARRALGAVERKREGQDGGQS